MKLTSYQEATVNHLINVFKEQDAYLVADEVGLGKTYIAKGLIEACDYKRILYIASNAAIAKQNAPDLIEGIPNAELIDGIDRLSMFDVNLEQEKTYVYPLTPATTFTGKGSKEGNQKERKYYIEKEKDERPSLTDTEVKQEIKELRKIYNDKAGKKFNPDFIILDEFHRFHDLLNPNPPKEQHYSLFQLIRNINSDRDKTHAPHVKLLLLSATPYNYHTSEVKLSTQYEDDQKDKQSNINEDHDPSKPFENFEKLVSYILALNDKVQGDWHLNSAEDYYKHILCRTERNWLQGHEMDVPYHDYTSVQFNPEDDYLIQPTPDIMKKLIPHLDYRMQYQKALSLKTRPSDCNELDTLIDNRLNDSTSLAQANHAGLAAQSYSNVRIFLDEAPEYAQFGDGYSTITKGSTGAQKEIDLLRQSFTEILMQTDYRLKKDCSSEPDSSFKYVISNHAKWNTLEETAMPESSELRLWIPPVLSENQSIFSKTIVFAHYRVTTRAVSALTSMEAQRRLQKKIGSIPVTEYITFDDDNTVLDELCRPLTDALEINTNQIKKLQDAIRKFFNTTHARRVLTAWKCTEVTEKTVLEYCREYRWEEMILEYLECLSKLEGFPTGAKKTEEVVNTLCEVMEWTDEDRTRILVLPDWKDQGYPCTFGERYTEDYSDKKAHDDYDTRGNKCNTTNRLEYIRNRFQSPFYPFVLASSETAQEGVNLHNYCQNIFHWSVPSRLNTFIQEDGRVDRRGSLAIRRQAVWLCRKSGNQLPQKISDCFNNIKKYYVSLGWNEDKIDSLRDKDLFPLWFLPAEEQWLKEGFPRMKRALFFLPFTNEQQDYTALLRAQAKYNSFGLKLNDEMLLKGEALKKSLCPLFHK